MTATEIVTSFVALLGLSQLELRARFSSIERSTPVSPLMAWTENGSGSRSGTIPGFGSFQLHGFGCRVVLESGEEVDFDWDSQGRAVFDGWRLRTFATSVGQSGTTEDDLVEAARALADHGLLAEGDEPGWFYVAETKADA